MNVALEADDWGVSGSVRTERSLDALPSSERLKYAAIVQSGQDREDLLTLFETLDGQDLGAALPSLCILAEQCTAPNLCMRVRRICSSVLYDSTSTRGDRKAALAALKVLSDGSFSWREFILLIETLEEPQFHIVRPVLTLFDSVYATTIEDGSLHCAEWVWLIVRRAAHHSNGWVRLWALEKAVLFQPNLLQLPSKPLFQITIPLLNSVDMLWRLVERDLLVDVMGKLSAQFQAFFRDSDDLCAESDLLLFFESVYLVTCPFTLFFLSLAVRDSQRPLLKDSHLPSCRRILNKITYMPYVILKNEATANFAEFLFRMMDWSSVSSINISSLCRLSSFVSRSTDDGLRDCRLGRLHQSLSQCFVTDFDVVSVLDSLAETLDEAKDNDAAWLLWTLASLNKKTELLEAELEKTIVETIANNEFPLVDFFIGVWLRNPCLGNVTSTFSTILSDYVLMRVFSLEGTEADRSTICHVFLPLLSLLPVVRSSLPECILQFLTQDVSTERQACLLPLLLSCLHLPVPSDLLQLIRKYLGASLSAQLPCKSVGDLSARDFQGVCEDVHTARTKLYRLSRNAETEDPASFCQELIQTLDVAAHFDRKAELISILTEEVDKVADENILVDVLNAVHNSCVEEKKSLNSLPALGLEMRLALQPCMLRNAKTVQRAQQIFDEYLQSAALSQSVSLVLAQSLREASDRIDASWAQQVVSVAIFGPVPKKDGRVISELYRMIFGLTHTDVSGCANVIDRLHETVHRARMTAIVVAIECASRCRLFAAALLRALLAECAELDKSSSRSFGLSFPHRGKTRAVALILLTADYVCDENVLSDLMEQCIFFVADPCQQFSIKLLVEWIIVRLSLRRSCFFEKLVACQQTLAPSRIGSVSSWINMLVHFSRVKSTDLTVLARILELIVPWSTAQNFSVRCTALAACRTIYAYLPKNEQSRWSLVKGIINFDAEPSGNARRVIDNLCNDFYFAYLHAENHFDIETVLNVLPQRTGLPDDELIEQQLIVELNSTRVRSLNSDSSFVQAPTLVYNSLAKCNTCAPEMVLEGDWELVPSETSGSSDVPGENGSLQRKIITSSRCKPTDCSLVVVASLVDKAANLGGLCRTSEIFGVDSLVLADEQLVKDTNFKALSMSSENWQRIEAVKPDNLADYLDGLRKKGYSVIAAEQTTDSQPMHSFQFPKKCVLLLGDEKEGVPTRLLRVVDQTVEITQMGQTRSLNVHVTAALFISKFAEQHLVR